MENEEITKAKSYAVTDAMKNNAKRGLALREKWGRGGLDTRQAGEQGIGSGVARSRDIIEGSLSLESVKRMYSFFSRHEKNYRPSKKEVDGGPTAGTISSLLWGGPAGFAWAKGILRKEGILKSLEKSLQASEDLGIQVAKALDEEQRIATFVVLEPQYEDGSTSDLHQDWYDEKEVFKAMMNFNRFCSKASLFHAVETDAVEFVESYCTKADMVLGGRFIRKGTWVASIYCPKDNEVAEYVWQGIKKGTFTGLSIQCIANAEYLEE